MDTQALSMLIMLVIWMVPLVGVAWGVSYMALLFKRHFQGQSLTGSGEKEPVHISLTGYFLVVIAVWVAVTMYDPMFGGIILVTVILPMAGLGLVPITIINRRHHRIKSAQLGGTATTKVKTAINYIFYWLGLAVFSLFSTLILFGGILEGSGNVYVEVLFETLGVVVMYVLTFLLFLFLYRAIFGAFAKVTDPAKTVEVVPRPSEPLQPHTDL